MLPQKLQDWQGMPIVIQNPQLVKSVYTHGYEAGIESPNDIGGCPFQPDRNKFQRKSYFFHFKRVLIRLNSSIRTFF